MNFNSGEIGLTNEKLQAWNNYFEQKAISSNSVQIASLSLSGMNYLKDHQFKKIEDNKATPPKGDLKVTEKKSDSKHINVVLDSQDNTRNVFVIL
jgi:hypothetical protein